MTKGDEYRRYAAECLALAQRRENAADKARLLRMVERWLQLAEVAETKKATDRSSSD
jgi:hypothetical protein